MVRSVERLRAELQVSALRDPERAEDTQVCLEETRTTQSIPSHRSKARASLRRPGTIRGAVYPKHRVVEPYPSARATLRHGANSARNRDCRIKLIRHLAAAAREQIRRIALNDVDRQTAHDTHYTAHLETTKHRTGPTLTSHALPFSERQIAHAVHLQVVLPVITGYAAIPLLRRQELNSRPLIVVGEIDSLGPHVRSSEKRAGPAPRKERLEPIIRQVAVWLNRVDVCCQTKLNREGT